ncbi:YbaN family protein [Pseudomarimonas salicorniae]|uniref:Inner membrane protein n=1 Tax=Pseudomarimonas salicorniae TaxID=2933270 RepID=A0ABT0GJ42_9GAMM|nr:YbaN family protein [Lysobacter sp. CAU 1642]
MSWRRPIWIALAGLFLALGLIGVLLPGLPTTPFVLLAAWAAARGSPRLHGWLLRHPLFGPMISDWQRGGAVHRRAKWAASATMALCAGLMFWLAPRWWMAGIGTALMAAVAGWLWLRPEPARRRLIAPAADTSQT